MPVDPAVLAIAATNLRASRYFQASAFIMLIYDHFITFDQEVERIWKQPWHFPTLLFFINRYVTPLQRIIIVIAFNDPNWGVNACKHFVGYEGGGTMVLVTIAEVIMIIRVYALFQRSKWVLLLLGTALLVQIGVTAGALSVGVAQKLPPPLVACVLVGRTTFFSAQWASTLGTDFLIFVLTLYKVYQTRKANLTIPLLEICVRDGILYFAVIFAANFFNTVMYNAAPTGVKTIGASFSQLLTAAMISRLQLNLRGVRHQQSLFVDAPRNPTSRGLKSVTSHAEIQSVTVSRIVGNLGEELELWSPTSQRSFIKDSHHVNIHPMYPMDDVEKRFGS